MPALSSTMTEGKIVSWLVGVGDKGEAGDAVMVVESDKADMDVESFEDGYIAAILVDDGESAAVGATVAIIVPNEGASAPCSAASPARATQQGRRALGAAQALGTPGELCGSSSPLLHTPDDTVPLLSSPIPLIPWLGSVLFQG